jgi:hypothetical protein
MLMKFNLFARFLAPAPAPAPAPSPAPAPAPSVAYAMAVLMRRRKDRLSHRENVMRVKGIAPFVSLDEDVN